MQEAVGACKGLRAVVARFNETFDSGKAKKCNPSACEDNWQAYSLERVDFVQENYKAKVQGFSQGETEIFTIIVKIKC